MFRQPAKRKISHRILQRTYLFLWLVVSLYSSTSLCAKDKPPAGLENIYHYHRGVEDSVWEAIAPYLLPKKHPIKKKLDKIFKKHRVIKDIGSLVKKGGFDKVIPQRWTNIIVTQHSRLPGYIFKLYLDQQNYHRKKPEHYFWLKRCQGAEIIAKEIDTHRWNDLFKVPKKWIYPLPARPSSSSKHFPKYFILVEEDMNIYKSHWNYQLWGSPFITTEKLDILFYILQKHGFLDCAKPDNIPICKDGRIAFVDTQSFNSWPVSFHKLYNLLSPVMLTYWKGLIENYKVNQQMPISD